MRKLHVVCPICSQSRRIPIPQAIFNIDEGALLKVPIHQNEICEHEFLVLLDYNFSIRDYEVLSSELFQRYCEESNRALEAQTFTFF